MTLTLRLKGLIERWERLNDIVKGNADKEVEMTEKISNEALKIWLDLPIDTRRRILSAVWCPQCTGSVTMCDYSAALEGGVVVLSGIKGNKKRRKMGLKTGDIGEHRRGTVTVSAVRG